MNITFYGAAGVVTGSCFLVTSSKGQNILVDCGLFQGPKEIKEKNYGEFPFKPSQIDAVVLTHAHIDHSGLIPKLCRKGFKGKIYTTIVTKDLCSILLPDSAYIQEMEVERKNRKLARANKPLLEPIYTVKDAEKCMEQFVGVNYEQSIEILPEIIVNFRDAGHIFGSSMIEIFVDGQKLVFSGDIGNIDQPIINDPTLIREADYVIMESTYGNRFHIETEDKLVQLARIVNKTLKKGGNLIIPAFAVERTQDIIYNLKKLINSGEIPPVDVYIDSPLAIKTTEIFCKYPLFYDEEATSLHEASESCILDFPSLKFSLTTEESIKLNSIKKNAIIISASGMCDAGRIKHHLKHNLWRPESTVLFVGYQAQGTLGRRILDGHKQVRIHGEEIAVNATIERIEGFSGHADQKGLVEWVKHFSPKPKLIFLVHGEEDARETLARVLREETGNQVILPKANETFNLPVKETIPTRIKADFTEAELEIRDLFQEFEINLRNILQVHKDKKQEILYQLEELKQKLA
mgnify:FL=1